MLEINAGFLISQVINKSIGSIIFSSMTALAMTSDNTYATKNKRQSLDCRVAKSAPRNDRNAAVTRATSLCQHNN